MVSKESREGQRRPLATKNKVSKSGEINMMDMNTKAIWSHIVEEKKYLGESLDQLNSQP